MPLSKLFIAENRQYCINFNAECVTNVTFYEVVSNSGTFKQASENSPISNYCSKMLQWKFV